MTGGFQTWTRGVPLTNMGMQRRQCCGKGNEFRVRKVGMEPPSAFRQRQIQRRLQCRCVIQTVCLDLEVTGKAQPWNWMRFPREDGWRWVPRTKPQGTVTFKEKWKSLKVNIQRKKRDQETEVSGKLKGWRVSRWNGQQCPRYQSIVQRRQVGWLSVWLFGVLKRSLSTGEWIFSKLLAKIIHNLSLYSLWII